MYACCSTTTSYAHLMHSLSHPTPTTLSQPCSTSSNLKYETWQPFALWKCEWMPFPSNAQNLTTHSFLMNTFIFYNKIGSISYPPITIVTNASKKFFKLSSKKPNFVSNISVATPLWGKCEDETHTPKSGNLESFETPAASELNSRGQNTLPWCVLYIVGKVLKV
jgi:hypothetical protein